MRDDAYTDPATIRATYQSRGRNRKLNVAKAESLGIKASQIAPATQAVAGGAGSSVAAGGSGGGGGDVLDPTLYADTSSGTYQETTYEGSKFKVEPIDAGTFDSKEFL